MKMNTSWLDFLITIVSLFIRIINIFQYLGHKRSKVKSDNHDDESLRKVWEAFKNAKIEDNILNLPEDASYFLGYDNSSNPMSTLFIRDCYLDLSKIIFNVIALVGVLPEIQELEKPFLVITCFI